MQQTDQHDRLTSLCMCPAQDIYKYLDILLFVEATIYQMDEENEALCEALTQGGISDNTQQHSFQGLWTSCRGTVCS
jgi:hypothetical protein